MDSKSFFLLTIFSILVFKSFTQGENVPANKTTLSKSKQSQIKTINDFANIRDMLETMYEQFTNRTSNWSLASVGRSDCGLVLAKLAKIPIFIILPAVIAGVAAIYYVVGFIVAYIPKWTGPFFESFMKEDTQEDNNTGWGWTGWTHNYTPQGTNYKNKPFQKALDTISNSFYNAMFKYGKKG